VQKDFICSHHFAPWQGQARSNLSSTQYLSISFSIVKFDNTASAMVQVLSLDQDSLSADEIQLRAQGHVGELPRQFGAFATLSLAFSITNSWVGYSAVFATPLLAGGGPTVFFGLIVATIACSIITAGLAELASAFPSSGGQYQYVHPVLLVSSEKI
jgi:hypothetical protein